MYLIFIILYALAGILLGIPYCLLAGWDPKSFMTIAFVAPAFLFIWLVVAIFAGVIDIDHRKKVYFNLRAAFGKNSQSVSPGSLFVFWLWTFYSFLPVIFHWSALFLEKIGYENVGSIINTHRYTVLVYVFIVALALIVLIGMVNTVWGKTKDIWTRFVYR